MKENEESFIFKIQFTHLKQIVICYFVCLSFTQACTRMLIGLIWLKFDGYLYFLHFIVFHNSKSVPDKLAVIFATTW